MKQTIHHETYGEILYEESSISGRKSISVGGVPLEKTSKKEFKLQDGSVATLKGNYFTGATIDIHGETIILIPKIKWFEIALGILPFILVLIWGNSYALCAIVPVVGGAIGGGISGLFSCIGIVGIKGVKPIWLKIIIALVSLGVTFAVCAGVGYVIIAAFS